jgi:putative ABC transport system permease protein
MKNFFFALCLAWRQLIFEKGKLIAAVLGITFACVLIFMQLGFRDALFGSVAKMPSSINGDLFIQHRERLCVKSFHA